ncbi:hypothetical protein GCM10010329_85090 [Streptomyces spiroverticillatus]|uniref:Uncharacterized protein n=1 Tax=Streptomyces finlayi TaxID=67296 RepID=A0A918X9C3_9ACTN|nr:hypothetical protein GCM10010329_85090 [Streptomyces spiroverticillatus]GHD19557.1 hypothetical protein GCM10010334_83340 [Streptomyces finlayi]
MWIGRPGALREITDGAKSFDRSPDLGVSEFRALEGGVTTWVPPVRPRRLKLQWEAMQRADVAHLDRLVERVDGIGPIVVLDPLSGNMLAPAQAAGLMADGVAQWSFDQRYGEVLRMASGSVIFTAKPPAGESVELVWVWHTRVARFPVHAGVPITWWPYSLLISYTDGIYLTWYDSANKVVATSRGNPGVPLEAVAPSGAVSVQPSVRLKEGSYYISGAVLALGYRAAQLIAGDRPTGDGCGPYSITGYSHSATSGDGAYRDIGLELVAVTP